MYIQLLCPLENSDIGIERDKHLKQSSLNLFIRKKINMICMVAGNISTVEASVIKQFTKTNIMLQVEPRDSMMFNKFSSTRDIKIALCLVVSLHERITVLCETFDLIRTKSSVPNVDFGQNTLEGIFGLETISQGILVLTNISPIFHQL